jgi:hypothetical protein
VQFPIHAVAEWLGDSPKTALVHYTQVMEEHFDRSAKSAAPRCKKRCSKESHGGRTVSQDFSESSENAENLRHAAAHCEKVREEAMTPTGLPGRSSNSDSGLEASLGCKSPHRLLGREEDTLANIDAAWQGLNKAAPGGKAARCRRQRVLHPGRRPGDSPRGGGAAGVLRSAGQPDAPLLAGEVEEP